MSAGDVLFVGWTGGSPSYKELMPSTSYEPLRVAGTFNYRNQEFINYPANYVWKNVTRRLICFNKDKDAVIGSLGFNNVELKSVYIDTDGSVKELDLGPGWELQTYDDAPFQTGYTTIQARYRKLVFINFEFNLPAGFSITCQDGKCRMNYNAKTIEEIDSGTGKCTSGLWIATNIYNKSPRPSSFSSPIDPTQYDEMTYGEIILKCNEVEFERYELKGLEMPRMGARHGYNYPSIALESSTKIIKNVDDLDAVTFDMNAWKNDTLWNESEINKVIDAYKGNYIDANYVTHSFKVNQAFSYKYNVDSSPLPSGPGWSILQKMSVELRIDRSLIVTAGYNLPENPRSIKASWQKNGNTIRLVAEIRGEFIKKTINIREYDVTGL